MPVLVSSLGPLPFATDVFSLSFIPLPCFLFYRICLICSLAMLFKLKYLSHLYVTGICSLAMLFKLKYLSHLNVTGIFSLAMLFKLKYLSHLNVTGIFSPIISIPLGSMTSLICTQSTRQSSHSTPNMV